MRTSSCCGAFLKPHAHRRKRCRACGKTFTIRPRTRGRKLKRQHLSLAHAILRNGTSLRGLSETRGINRETLRRRFYGSAAAWLRAHPLPEVPEQGPLIAMADALWFQTRNHKPKYGCFGILIRPVNETTGYVTVLTLRRGRESKVAWQQVIKLLPRSVRKRIVALIADGFTGLSSIAAEEGWHFQWCHIHVRRRLAELRGLRKVPGREIRRQAQRLIHTFLETEDEARANECQRRLRRLFALPECPPTLPTRLSGVIHRSHLLRTYRHVPDLNLPVSTNSIERVNAFIRERVRLARGLNSEKSLRHWLRILQHQHPKIQCRGFKETIDKNHRKSVS